MHQIYFYVNFIEVYWSLLSLYWNKAKMNHPTDQNIKEFKNTKEKLNKNKYNSYFCIILVI